MHLCFSCISYLSSHSMNRQNSAQHAKPHKSCCAIAVNAATCSFSLQGSLLFPGTSQFCQFLPPSPRGRGGTRLKPDPVQDKKSFNACPVQDNTLNLLHCSGQRTKCAPTYFKAIFWQLQQTKISRYNYCFCLQINFIKQNQIRQYPVYIWDRLTRNYIPCLFVELLGIFDFGLILLHPHI